MDPTKALPTSHLIDELGNNDSDRICAAHSAGKPASISTNELKPARVADLTAELEALQGLNPSNAVFADVVAEIARVAEQLSSRGEGEAVKDQAKSFLRNSRLSREDLRLIETCLSHGVREFEAAAENLGLTPTNLILKARACAQALERLGDAKLAVIESLGLSGLVDFVRTYR